MPVEKLHPTFTFTEDRLRELQAVVPEAFADGQVNWATLREALGAYLEDEGPGTEHFGLFWPGKRQARRLAAQPSKGTLRPAPGEGAWQAEYPHALPPAQQVTLLHTLPPAPPESSPPPAASPEFAVLMKNMLKRPGRS